nr:MAG TPA: hypothetical protein [Bacteriophage sp.]
MDAYCKIGDFNTEHNLAVMEKKFKDNEADEEDITKAVLAVTEALNNFRTLDLPKPLESEKEVIVPLTEKYGLKAKFDAFY